MNCPVCSIPLHTQSSPLVLHPKSDCLLSLAELRYEHWLVVSGIKRDGANAIIKALTDAPLPDKKMIAVSDMGAWIEGRLMELWKAANE